MNNTIKDLWNKVKTPLKMAAIVTTMGLLPSSCKKSDKNEPIKDLGYYHSNHLPLEREDMYGNSIISHTVEIKIYKDETMMDEWNGSIVQIRWGIYKDELEKTFNNQKTHAEFVYLDDVSDNQGWIEVFDYNGVSICKDQPCFLVGKDGRLRIIGDKKHYENNLNIYCARLKQEKEFARKAAERNKQRYREQYKEKKRSWDSKQIEVMRSKGFDENGDTIADKTGHNQRLSNDSIVKDSTNMQISTQIKTDTLIADSLNNR